MIDPEKIFKGKVVILCVGNVDKGDDGAGPYLASEIHGKCPYEVINGGIAPENYTGVLKKMDPDTVIIADAVDFGGKTGEIRIFSGGDLRSGSVSTHDVSLKLLIEYLKASMDADIYVLGIMPGANRSGKNLSDEVKNAVKTLIPVFCVDKNT